MYARSARQCYEIIPELKKFIDDNDKMFKFGHSSRDVQKAQRREIHGENIVKHVSTIVFN
jgi:hypothetical protein